METLRRTATSRSTGACRLALGLLLLIAPGACGGPSPEHQVLTKFFEASKLYDKTRLASFATVAFNPVTDGVVEEFAITRMSGEHTLDAGRSSEEVTLAAQVRTADGRTSARTLIATMEKADGRWKVVRLR